MLPLQGKPIIQHVYDRIKRCNNVTEVLVSIPNKSSDELINKHFKKMGVSVYLGSEDDPLDRIYKTAKNFQSKHILRVMADCPLLDPIVVDEVLNKYIDCSADVCYLSGNFPTGLDTTVFSFDILEKAWSEAKLISDRQHITPYMLKCIKDYKVVPHEIKFAMPNLRLVMDHAEDYEFVKSVYEYLYNEHHLFITNDIEKLVDKVPDLRHINSHILRDQGYLKDLAKDSKQKVMNT